MPRCEGFGGAGARPECCRRIPPALRFGLEVQNRRPFLRQGKQEAGATSSPAQERLNTRLNQREK
jgi:hypothetical protein